MDYYKIGNVARDDIYPKSEFFLYYTDNLGNILVTSDGDRIGEAYVPLEQKFVGVYDTSISGGDDRTILLPYPSGNTTDWGDGEVNTSNTHIYASNGIYEITTEGEINGFSYNSDQPAYLYRNRLTEIKDWSGLVFDGTNPKAFYGCGGLEVVPMDHGPIIETNNLADFFNGCQDLAEFNLNVWGMSGVNNVSYMFAACYKLSKFYANDCDFSNVTNMNGMFADVGSYIEEGCVAEISDWNTSSAEDMSFIFQYSRIVNGTQSLDLSNWDTSNVETFRSALRGWRGTGTLNLSNWSFASANTSQYSGAYLMLDNCDASTLTLRNWNLGTLIYLFKTFQLISATTIDTTGWIMPNLTSFISSFINANDNIDSSFVENFDMSKITNITSMLDGVTLTSIDLSSWQIPVLASANNFLDDATINSTDYDNALINFASQSVKSYVYIDFGNSKYSTTGATARDVLTNTYNWTIIDGGPE